MFCHPQNGTNFYNKNSSWEVQVLTLVCRMMWDTLMKTIDRHLLSLRATSIKAQNTITISIQIEDWTSSYCCRGTAFTCDVLYPSPTLNYFPCSTLPINMGPLASTRRVQSLTGQSAEYKREKEGGEEVLGQECFQLGHFTTRPSLDSRFERANTSNRRADTTRNRGYQNRNKAPKSQQNYEHI